METTKIRDERSIGDLLKELRDDTTLLVSQEVSLAKTEMNEKVSRVGRNVGFLAAGGLVAYAALLFVLLGLSALLVVGLEAAGLSGEAAVWLAPLIVGVVVGMIGGALVGKAIGTLKRESGAPRQTIDSIKENKQWLKSRLGR